MRNGERGVRNDRGSDAVPPVPSTGGRKEQYVRDMFASIARRYDLLNSLLSFNRHRYWRRFAVGMCDLRPGDAALDVGTGTGDLAIELCRAVGANGRVIGVDFCRPMLDVGAEKISRGGLGSIRLIEGNAERLPVPSDAFQAAATAFTLRNVANIEGALAEMTRAAAPGGRVVVLELARPRGAVFSRVFDLYLHRVLPLIGGAVNRRRGPYDYLPASVASFVSREELKEAMEKVGLADVRIYNLTAGIATVHVGTKRPTVEAVEGLPYGFYTVPQGPCAGPTQP